MSSFKNQKPQASRILLTLCLALAIVGHAKGVLIPEFIGTLPGDGSSINLLNTGTGRDMLCSSPAGTYTVKSFLGTDISSVRNSPMEFYVFDSAPESDRSPATKVNFERETYAFYVCAFYSETNFVVFTEYNQLAFYTISDTDLSVSSAKSPITENTSGKNKFSTSTRGGKVLMAFKVRILFFDGSDPATVTTLDPTTSSVVSGNVVSIAIDPVETSTKFILGGETDIYVMDFTNTALDQSYGTQVFAAVAMAYNLASPAKILMATASGDIAYFSIESQTFSQTFSLTGTGMSFDHDDISNIVGSEFFLLRTDTDLFALDTSASTPSLVSINSDVQALIPAGLTPVTSSYLKRTSEAENWFSIVYNGNSEQFIFSFSLKECHDSCTSCEASRDSNSCLTCPNGKPITGGPGPCSCDSSCQECNAYNDAGKCSSCPDPANVDLIPHSEATTDNQYGHCSRFDEITQGMNTPISECEGKKIIGCISCSKFTQGYCAECIFGFGLVRLSELRSSGMRCKMCPGGNCKVCKIPEGEDELQCLECGKGSTLMKNKEGNMVCQAVGWLLSITSGVFWIGVFGFFRGV